MKRILAAVVMLVFLTPPALAQQRLQGDPEAVARVELMLERLGGAEVWARTRTLYMMYQGWRIDPDEPVIEEAWRDLAQPGEYIVFEGRSFKFERIFTRQAGWHVRNNEVRELTAEQQRAGLDFWPRDFYTMIRR
ncbi:MAG: hypothetical protein MJA83_14430, partial [Gammaproteobacteria bacterium]|nr:hypothetical protein [Gammaproteobacteria bacterium]